MIKYNRNKRLWTKLQVAKIKINNGGSRKVNYNLLTFVIGKNVIYFL